MKFEDVAKALQQLGPNMNALLVGLQRGVVRQIGPLEHFAQRQPLLVADGADEELLAVSERKDVVHAPRGYARRHRRWRFSGHRELLHVLCAKEHAVLEQRTLHFLSATGVFALAQRRENADRAEHAAHDVVDRCSCA